MEGEWSCYRSGPFNGEWSCYINRQFYWRENGHVMEVDSLKEVKWSYYRGGQWWRENGHVTEAASLMEEEQSCYRGGQFDGGKMVMLRRWSL